MKSKKKFKVLTASKISPLKGFFFWLIVALLPVIVGKTFFNFYSEQMKSEVKHDAHTRLKRDIFQFERNTDMEYFIQSNLNIITSKIRRNKFLDFKILKEQIFNLSNQEIGCSPVLILVCDDKFNHVHISKKDRKGRIGKRAAIIILKYLKKIQKVDDSNIPEMQKNMYLQLCKPIFGSYIKPAKRVGKVVSGFTEKYNGDRVFIYYNDYYSVKSDKVYTSLIVLRESQVSLHKLFQWALKNNASNQVSRGYSYDMASSSCGFIDKEDVFSVKVPLRYSVLRYGSHVKRSIYDKFSKRYSIKNLPSKMFFLVSSIRNSQKRISKIKSLVNLIFFFFFCISLVVVKNAFFLGKLGASIRQSLLIAIFLAVVSPIVAFLLLTNRAVYFYSEVKMQSRLSKMEQNLRVLELELKNHDIMVRNNLEKLRNQLKINLNADKKILTRILDSNFKKNYTGYFYLRNDGTMIKRIPSQKVIGKFRYKVLNFVAEIALAQTIGIFSHLDLLLPSFNDTLKSSKGKKIVAMGEMFTDIDRDCFCRQDAQPFVGKGAMASQFRLVSYNVFPEEKDSKYWAVLILLQNFNNITSQFIKNNGSVQRNFLVRSNGMITETSIFTGLDKQCNHLNAKVAWPVSSLGDKDLFNAAKRLAVGKKQQSWISYSDKGVPTLFSGRKINGYPLIAVSRVVYTDDVTKTYLANIISLLFLLCSILLVSAITSYLSDIFIKPITKLIKGVHLLNEREWPKIKITGANELSNLTLQFNQMVVGLEERKKLDRFVSKEVSEAVKSETETLSDFANRKESRTVMFIHIRNFDELSENYIAEDVIQILNTYFKFVEPAIIKNKGNIDKYIGDAVMATYQGVDSPVFACDAAISLVSLIDNMNIELLAANLPEIQIGIGINCGTVLVGKIGSDKGRKDFTVIGDTVNLAARLESISHYGDKSHIIVSDEIHVAAKRKFIFTNRGVTKVKGKSKEITIFELMDYKQ